MRDDVRLLSDFVENRMVTRGYRVTPVSSAQ
jgi:hypothetical protein